MSKDYGLYDMKNNEECVIIGNMNEIAKYLNCPASTLRSYLSRKKYRTLSLIKHRYELAEILSIDEPEEPINRKTNQEIFNELLNSFKPKKAEFEVFDENKWKLKRIKRQNYS